MRFGSVIRYCLGAEVIITIPYREFRVPRYCRVGTTRSKAGSARRGRQDNRRKKRKKLEWSGDVATAHCLHSFGKRQRAEPPAVCLSSVSTAFVLRPASLTHTRTFVCFHALSITTSYLHDTRETDLFLNIFRSLS